MYGSLPCHHKSRLHLLVVEVMVPLGILNRKDLPDLEQ